MCMVYELIIYYKSRKENPQVFMKNCRQKAPRKHIRA
jgi:hypothetical protein